MTEAFIYDALRTPRGRGDAHGSLYEVKPVDLLAILLRSLRDRRELPTDQVEDVLIGCVTPVGDQGANLPQAALRHAGWNTSAGGLQLNRLDASGLAAVNLAAMKIRSGWAELVVAGGVESMSRIPAGSDGGPMVYDPELINRTHYIPQGIAADLIATVEGYNREALDAYALRSWQRAAQARQADYFDPALVPIVDRNGLLILEKDEYPLSVLTTEELAALPPAFATTGDRGFDALALQRYPLVEQIHHLHTTGNTAGQADGAALVLLGSRAKGEALGWKPRARIRAVAAAGVTQDLLLTGTAPAARKALQLAGMKTLDIDLWENNEAFAAAVIKFQEELKIQEEKLNVNGGAIALGHPLGATGAILVGTLLDELERRDLSTGLVAMCAGNGLGVSTIIERV